MVILGIDPGSVITGYAIVKDHGDIRNLELVDFGCIVTEKFASTQERLLTVHREITKLIEAHHPKLLSIESVFFFRNVTTAIPVSQTRGVVLLAAAQKKLPMVEFTPMQIKMAMTGYGRAEKKQIQKMVENTVDVKKFDLKKNFRKKDDAYDAVAAAICAAIKRF